MWSEFQGWLADGREAILAAAGVGLLVATMAVGFMKRSLLAAFGTLIFGALLLWGMSNSDWLRDKAGEDFNTAPATAIVDEASRRAMSCCGRRGRVHRLRLLHARAPSPGGPRLARVDEAPVPDHRPGTRCVLRDRHGDGRHLGEGRVVDVAVAHTAQCDAVRGRADRNGCRVAVRTR